MVQKPHDPCGRSCLAAGQGGERVLGLSCSEAGLYLGRTALVERRAGGYVVRPQAELERLFERAYGAGSPTLQPVLPGLATVASALGQNNLSLAQIAALHLRLPDLTDAVTRAGLEAEDFLIKSGRASGDWAETAHPRAGTPPNPGWFAPKPGPDAHSRPTQTAQRGRGDREREELRDPIAPVRQALWNARIDLLRRIDPNNSNLTYFSNSNSPPSQAALDRLDAEVTGTIARVADTISKGHAYRRHRADFPKFQEIPNLRASSSGSFQSIFTG